jgi:hypothetical protein
MENKLELYQQKYKKKTFIKTKFGYKQRCIILVEEIQRDEFDNIQARGLGVNAANEFRYAEFGLDGNEVCDATRSEIEFWKKQRVKAFFNDNFKVMLNNC